MVNTYTETSVSNAFTKLDFFETGYSVVATALSTFYILRPLLPAHKTTHFREYLGCDTTNL